MSIFSNSTKKTFQHLFESYLSYLPIRLSKETTLTYSGRLSAIRIALDLDDFDPEESSAFNSLKHNFYNFIINDGLANSFSEKTTNYKNLHIAVFNDFCKYCCLTHNLFCNEKIAYLKKTSLTSKACTTKEINCHAKK